MVGANFPRDVSETSQTDRISGSEMLLEEKGGEMEHKLENTFISFRIRILVASNIPIILSLGQNRCERTLCRSIYSFVYTREDARGNFSCSLGIIESRFC